MIHEKILFVDDDPNILRAYKRHLRKAINIEVALGPREGLEAIDSKGPFAVVISDLRMPGMDGIEFLTRVKDRSPDSVRMMLTGNADVETAVQAINEGNIFRFLKKPCPQETMGRALIAGLEQHRLMTAEKEVIENTLNGCITMLTEVLSMVCPEAFGRAVKLKDSVRFVARELRIRDDWELQLASMFSQIGYVAIPPKLVEKSLSGGDLSTPEEAVVSRMPQIGSDLIKNIPRLETVARIVLYQNKRFDGTGFPEDSVAGENIPLGSRILKVLLDLTQAESRGIERKQAYSEMKDREGWYDPRIIEAVATACVMGTLGDATQETVRLDVSFSELRVGDFLISNIETTDSKLLIVSRNVVSQVLLERLANYHKVIGVREPIHVERVVSRVRREI